MGSLRPRAHSSSSESSARGRIRKEEPRSRRAASRTLSPVSALTQAKREGSTPKAAAGLAPPVLGLGGFHLIGLGRDQAPGQGLGSDPVHHLQVEFRRADLRVDEGEDHAQGGAAQQVAFDHRAPARAFRHGTQGEAVAGEVD